MELATHESRETIWTIAECRALVSSFISDLQSVDIKAYRHRAQVHMYIYIYIYIYIYVLGGIVGLAW